MIEVVNQETEQRQRSNEIIPWKESLCSEDSWTGICLEQGESEPAEAPENVCSNHVVWMHIGLPTRFENRVPGQGFRPRTLMPQSILLFPAGVPVQGRWRDPIASIGLQIEPELFWKAVGDDVATGHSELRHGYFASDPFITQVLHALRRDLLEGSPGGKLYGDCLGNALVAHLLRDYAAHRRFHPSAGGGLPPNRLRRVMEYIHDRLEKDLSLQDLAGVVGLNQGHFARAFKQTTGLTPYRYVLVQRIERACRLLENPRISIVEISAQCGFCSQSSFTTAFRRIKGVTPLVYRNAMP
jgi:AraC family transcriptional regulator